MVGNAHAQCVRSVVFTNSTGLGNIFAKLIRECEDLICRPICNISNQSISQLGIFPYD